MNKPHIHADVIKAWADGAEIQARSCSSLCENKWGGWYNIEKPEWIPHQEYRVKPPPRPDVVKYLGISSNDSYTADEHFIINHWPDQLKLIFDGETGKLKSAEIL
jgi:hypothetical protein